MLALTCPAQNYAWGRPADKSQVAQLAKANGVAIDESKPFAELWMGTHPSGPALIAGSGTTLKAWIEQHPEALGEAVTKRFGSDLPYLFKVLSVETALSIQSHPDKKLAERLHASNPRDYRDGNHKPEMALALEGFSALCGFVSHEELKQALRANEELRAVVGEGPSAALLEAEGDGVKPALKAAFTALMTADPATVSAAIDGLTARLAAKAGAKGGALAPKEALVLQLNGQYPGDVGVLSAFFLNYLTLPAGEAIYLAANEPHAYVSGELVECMAASDNVIR
ncbi:mannose-6-phosphate isomerase, partial [Raphidocelis subcapitata]